MERNTIQGEYIENKNILKAWRMFTMRKMEKNGKKTY